MKAKMYIRGEVHVIRADRYVYTCGPLCIYVQDGYVLSWKS